MVNKNIQIQDVAGNNLFPKTLGSIVFNNANENLGGVEANAQVNKIETVKVNGEALTIDGKAVNIEIAAQAEYSIVKAAAAEEGMAATYQLAKDGVAFGEKINIPKDMVVESGELKICEEDDKPVAGLKVGDPYIDLVIANADNQHIYIPVKDLVDVYTQGNGITITGHTIAIDDAVVVNHTEFATELAKKQDNLTTEQLAAVNSGITAELVGKYNGYEATIAGKQEQLSAAQLLAVNSGITADKLAALETHAADTVKHITAEERTAWNAKQAALTEAQLAAVDSGITAEIKAAYDTHVADAVKHITAAERTAWNGKQAALDETQMAAVNSGVDATAKAKYDAYETGKADVATTLSGYGILDGLTYVELA